MSAPGRIQIQEDGEVLRVVLPPRREPPALVALGMLGVLLLLNVGPQALSCLALVSDSALVGTLARPALGITVLFGLCSLAVLLWLVFGREILELHPELFIHQKLVFGVGGTWTYEVARIKNLRVDPPPPPARPRWDRDEAWFGDELGVSGGLIAFDYDSWTYRCGTALNEAEAKQIIDRLAARDPRLRTPAA
jgi:hypothetical protein